MHLQHLRILQVPDQLGSSCLLIIFYSWAGGTYHTCTSSLPCSQGRCAHPPNWPGHWTSLHTGYTSLSVDSSPDQLQCWLQPSGQFFFFLIGRYSSGTSITLPLRWVLRACPQLNVLEQEHWKSLQSCVFSGATANDEVLESFSRNLGNYNCTPDHVEFSHAFPGWLQVASAELTSWGLPLSIVSPMAGVNVLGQLTTLANVFLCILCS